MGETAKLPDGSMFEFWEDETVYDIVLHVNSTHPDADDRNAGTLKAPRSEERRVGKECRSRCSSDPRQQRKGQCLERVS